MNVKNRKEHNKFLSNSMMVSPNDYSPQRSGLASGEHFMFKFSGSKKLSLPSQNQNHVESPERVKCPPITQRG